MINFLKFYRKTLLSFKLVNLLGFLNKSVVVLLMTAVLIPQLQAQAQTEGGKGIGPITEVKIDPSVIDAALADKGKTNFEIKCSACHKWEERYVGPALNGVTKRREPEWIMNMMLNPLEMTQKNEVAQDLFGTYLIQMTFQNVTQEDSRSILEYFRKLDQAQK